MPSSHSPLPAGGVPSPPADPPAASPTRLMGQKETNLPQSEPKNNDLADETRNSAFEFGWQSYLQLGRTEAMPAVTFESVEAELERRWSARQAPNQNEARTPWQTARAAARDAWNQVQNALVDGTQAKPGAR